MGLMLGGLQSVLGKFISGAYDSTAANAVSSGVEQLQNNVSAPPSVSIQSVSAPPKTTLGYTVRVNTVLNIRSGPGTNHSIVGEFSNGAEIEVLEITPDNWCRIVYNGIDAWVFGDYLELRSGESGGSPPAPVDFSGGQSGADSNWSSYNIVPDYFDSTKPVEIDEYVSHPNQYEDPYHNFKFQNGDISYTRAKMSVTVNNNGAPAVYHFEFLIGPGVMTENRNNAVSPIKTGGGFFILRGGPSLTNLSLSGYLLDVNERDERRLFLEDYYNKHLVDRINAFHEYFNESSLEIELMGYRYNCILTDLQLQQSSDSLFIFRYNMNLLVTSQELIFDLQRPRPLSNIRKPSFVAETIKNLGKKLSELLAPIFYGGK